MTECQKFAQYVDHVAATSSSDKEFMATLGENVSGFPNGQAGIDFGKSKVTFGESGFNSKYVDGDGHPARHFTANMVFSFQQSPAASRLAAVVREIPHLSWIGGCKGKACSFQDVRLGLQGASAGGQVRNGTVKRTELGDWIRKNL